MRLRWEALQWLQCEAESRQALEHWRAQQAEAERAPPNAYPDDGRRRGKRKEVGERAEQGPPTTCRTRHFQLHSPLLKKGLDKEDIDTPSR